MTSPEFNPSLRLLAPLPAPAPAPSPPPGMWYIATRFHQLAINFNLKPPAKPLASLTRERASEPNRAEQPRAEVNPFRHPRSPPPCGPLRFEREGERERERGRERERERGRSAGPELSAHPSDPPSPPVCPFRPSPRDRELRLLRSLAFAETFALQVKAKRRVRLTSSPCIPR